MKREPCPNCGYNDWRETRISKWLNPNGEYVQGYGHAPVFVQDGSLWHCVGCGWQEGGNPVIIDIVGRRLIPVAPDIYKKE